MLCLNGKTVFLALGLWVQGVFVVGQAPQPLTLPAAPPSPIQPVDLREKALSPADAARRRAAWARAMEQDPRALSPLNQQMLQGARRGADWLTRANTTKGLFLPGIDPALTTEATGGPLGQVAAAWTLARASGAFGDERYEMRALQALLACLDDTQADSEDPQARHSSIPSAVISRPAATSWLLAAVCALETPPAELLERAESLARYLARQAGQENLATIIAKVEPGTPALVAYALLRSYRHQPAAWKLEGARKAMAIAKALPVETLPQALPWPILALAEMSQHDAACLPLLNSATDTVVSWQADKVDPRHPGWFGGWPLPAARGGLPTAPTCVGSAMALTALCEAALVARRQGDLARHQRLHDAMDRGAQYLLQLQFTDSNTQHFADWYRPRLLGGFRSGAGEATLRLEQNHHAVMALLGCSQDATP